MVAAVVAAGMLAQAAVWWLISARRVPFWPATTATFAILGIAAVLVGAPGSTDVSSLLVGAGSGAALYGATRVVVASLLEQIPSFASSVSDVYGRSQEVPGTAVWVLTLAVAIPGEELFWRGLVLSQLQDVTTAAVGVGLAWFGYVAANAVLRNLSIFVAAVVGGAVWTVLGSVRDVGAAVASHLVWTSLMLLWPPRAARGKVPS
ncbi:MAG: CPBP family glutamic-type intramembrane protease [Actinomycetota bacterium]